MVLVANDEPRLVLGTAQLSTDYGVTRGKSPVKTHREASQFLQFASHLGIGALDTAPAYGAAESIIGESGLSFSIHTKVTKGRDCLTSLRESQSRLNSRAIDILYVHDIDDFRRRPREIDDELKTCLDNGVSRVGVSLYSPDEIEFVLSCRNIKVVQVPMNVLDRRFLESVPLLSAAGISCIVRSVFLQGTLLQKYEDLPPRVGKLKSSVKQFQELCGHHGISFLQGTLGWIRAIGGIEGVIIGAQTTEELHDIVGVWNATRHTQCMDFSELNLPDENAVDPRQWSIG